MAPLFFHSLANLMVVGFLGMMMLIFGCCAWPWLTAWWCTPGVASVEEGEKSACIGYLSGNGPDHER